MLYGICVRKAAIAVAAKTYLDGEAQKVAAASLGALGERIQRLLSLLRRSNEIKRVRYSRINLSKGKLLH